MKNAQPQQHTPGPWYATEHAITNYPPDVANAPSRRGSKCIAMAPLLSQFSKADAAILGAAPDLLDSLKECIAYLENMDEGDSGPAQRAKAMVAKATA